MPEEIKDKDVKVGNKTIGFSSIVKMNVKTAILILTLAWFALGYLYLDQRKTIKESSSILQTEKQEFFKGVETTINRDISDIKVEQAEMRGEFNVGFEKIQGNIQLIFEKLDKENPITPTNNSVSSTVPPLENNPTQ